MKYNTIKSYIFLAVALLVTSCSDETVSESNRMVSITVSMPQENYSTRVGLTPVEGEKTLVASFHLDDEFSVYVRQGDVIQEVEASFAADYVEHKEGTLKFALPAFVKENEEYTIYGICGASSRIKNGRLVVDDNSKIEPINEFRAPIWFKYTGKKVPSILPCEYIGTYIVLHVTNQSKAENLFQIFGLISGALYDDLYWDENTNTFSEDFGVSPSSKSVPLKPGEEGVFIYNGIPNGKSMETLNVSMHIGPEITWGMDIEKPKTPKTVGKTLEEGRAYHVYLTWDGEELKFGDADISERDETIIYPTDSYMLSQDKKTLTKWYGEETDINLSSDPAFDEVETINEMAFSRCSHLESITLSANVKTVGRWAFQYCNNLHTVKLPSSLTTIMRSAFYQCSSLQNIDVPEGVKEIQDWAFEGCSNLTQIGLPSKINSFGKGVFYGCSSLQTVELPEGMEEIGTSTFQDCVALRSIVLPTTVKSIQAWGFWECKNLVDVSINSQLDSIGKYAFTGTGITEIQIPYVRDIGYMAFGSCKNLRRVTISGGLKTIGERAFYESEQLSRIDTEGPLEEIGSEAFSGLSKLREFKLPETLKVMDTQCFSSTGLTHVEVPNSVIKLGDGAFSWCSNLVSAKLSKSIQEISYTFDNCTALQTVEIPEGSLRKIGWYTFGSCASLKELTFPSTITEVEEPFYENNSLVKLTVKAVNPPASISHFGFGLPNRQNLTLFVPSSSIAAYKSHELWGQCGTIKSL